MTEEETIASNRAEELFRIPAAQHPPIAVRDTDGTRHESETERTYPIVGFTLRDATIHHPNVVTMPGDVLLDSNVGYTSSELCDHHPPDYPLTRDPALHLRSGLECAYHSTDPIGAVCLAAQPNYSSWLLGELPRVLLAEKHVKGFEVIVHGDAHAFHFDSLKDAGIAADRIRHVPGNGYVRVERLIWVTPTYFHHMPHPAGTAEVAKLGGAAHPSGHPLIYASRSNPAITQRRIVNERAVETLLASRGFTVIRPEALSYDRQKGHAAGARIFAAPFGAALASTVFCAEGSIVLQLATKFSFEFVRLAAQRHLDVVQVGTLRRKVRDAPSYSASHEFMVEPREIEKALAVAEALGEGGR